MAIARNEVAPCDIADTKADLSAHIVRLEYNVSFNVMVFVTILYNLCKFNFISSNIKMTQVQ